jgi:hypothetical protein
MSWVSKLKPTKFDGIVELLSSRMAVTFTGMLPKLSEEAYSREIKSNCLTEGPSILLRWCELR